MLLLSSLSTRFVAKQQIAFFPCALHVRMIECFVTVMATGLSMFGSCCVVDCSCIYRVEAVGVRDLGGRLIDASPLQQADFPFL